MEQELNDVNQSPPDCVYFRALFVSAICHLQQVFLILHHEASI